MYICMYTYMCVSYTHIHVCVCGREQKYLAVADQIQEEEEEATRRLLPSPLNNTPQRLLEGWCIIDHKGAYLAPWHAVRHVCVYGTR